MPFGIPNEDFHDGFGLPDTTSDTFDNERDTKEQEDRLTKLLIEAGVTWFVRDKARFLISRGVSVNK